MFGFAFVDCAALKFWVGSISDDASCAALGALLMQVCSSVLFFVPVTCKNVACHNIMLSFVALAFIIRCHQRKLFMKAKVIFFLQINKG